MTLNQFLTNAGSKAGSELTSAQHVEERFVNEHIDRLNALMLLCLAAAAVAFLFSLVVSKCNNTTHSDSGSDRATNVDRCKAFFRGIARGFSFLLVTYFLAYVALNVHSQMPISTHERHHIEDDLFGEHLKNFSMIFCALLAVIALSAAIWALLHNFVQQFLMYGGFSVAFLLALALFIAEDSWRQLFEPAMDNFLSKV